MAMRFSDEIVQNAQDASFVTRDRRPLILRILLTFTMSFIAIYLSAILMNLFDHRIFFLLVLFVIIGSLAFITLLSASQHHDLVMVTEFQNAILASATQVNARFCLVTKRDGSIVYIDPNFQQFFPQFTQNATMNISGLIPYSETPGELTNAIHKYIDQNHSGNIQIRLKDAQNIPQLLMVTVNLLPKPKGYFLVRGRDFVDQRSDVNAAAPAIGGLAIQALDAGRELVLITSSNGTIQHVSHVLEKWLGYTRGEMANLSLNLDQIVQYHVVKTPGAASFEAYEGNATLQRKDRTFTNIQLRQVILGDAKHPAGVSIFIPSDLIKT